MTTGEPTLRTKQELESICDSVRFWWHSIDLGHGVVTPGVKSVDQLAHEWTALRLPDLTGKTVLDIGAYDGFFSFESERRGAARVVALDHFVWSIDLPAHIRDWREHKEKGTSPPPIEQSSHWRPNELPGKKAFDAAYSALNSQVEVVIGDFMTMDLEPLGKFDVVLYLGVLYHMEDPLRSLRHVASVTAPGGIALIETEAVEYPGIDHIPMFEFFPGSELNGDPSNWWAPNQAGLIGLCRAAGFGHVEILQGAPPFANGRPRMRQRIRQAMSYVRRGGPSLREIEAKHNPITPIRYRSFIRVN